MTLRRIHFVDYTLLQVGVDLADCNRVFQRAQKLGLYSVCVPGSLVLRTKSALTDSEVKVCAAVGYPLGSCTKSVVEYATKCAARDGADEIVTVLSPSFSKDSFMALARERIKAIVQAAGRCSVTVICEVSLLSRKHKMLVCRVCRNVKAAAVSTCTIFSGHEVTTSDVTLLAQGTYPLTVEACGGVLTWTQVDDLVAAGATRIGVSGDLSFLRGR